MAERHGRGNPSQMVLRYRGRGAQIWIYLGKLIRMFVYQNDWKVLPMSALIAGLVGMVIRKRLFINMEGTLIGAFAIVCVCIWNGCFNSIQVICRERDVIKREHRSGMHISSYILAHMIYQALLCLMQTVVTLHVSRLVGVHYENGTPLFTRWFLADFGISMFLITYASDMMALWISSLAHSTTTAMTIMPFVLIFELVFSGGMMSLPEWTKYFTPLTISNPGLKVLAAQGDYNARPLQTIWNQVNKMSKKEVSTTISLGQLLDALGNTENETIAKIRSVDFSQMFTLGEIMDMFGNSDLFTALKDQHILEKMTTRQMLTSFSSTEEFSRVRDKSVGIPGITVGRLLNMVLESGNLKQVLDRPLSSEMTIGDFWNVLNQAIADGQYRDLTLNVTLGQVIDYLAASTTVQSYRDTGYTFSSTVGDIIKLIGEEKVRDLLEVKLAEASYDKAYEYSEMNVITHWGTLIEFVLVFAALAMITLEFIDKDKR